MIAYYIAIALVIVPIWLACVGLKKYIKKISLKFLLWAFILVQLLDSISTALCLQKFNHDPNVEWNPFGRWLLHAFSLPDIVVIFFGKMIVLLPLFIIGTYCWRKNESWGIRIKIFLCTLSVGCLLASLYNFVIYAI